MTNDKPEADPLPVDMPNSPSEEIARFNSYQVQEHVSETGEDKRIWVKFEDHQTEMRKAHNLQQHHLKLLSDEMAGRHFLAQATDRIMELETALSQAKKEGMEEAAKISEDCYLTADDAYSPEDYPEFIAKAIRAKA